MEARVSTLEANVDNLKDRFDKHEAEDDRHHRYATHVIEDVQTRLAGIERTGVRFETDLAHRNGRETATTKALDEIFSRLRMLERLAYIAIGGIIVLGGLWTTIGVKLLGLVR